MDAQSPRVCVGVIVLNTKGEMLLLRSHKWKNQWVVPGGGVEWGERSEDTVKREVLEETGLRITDAQFRLNGTFVRLRSAAKQCFDHFHFLIAGQTRMYGN